MSEDWIDDLLGRGEGPVAPPEDFRERLWRDWRRAGRAPTPSADGIRWGCRVCAHGRIALGGLCTYAGAAAPFLGSSDPDRGGGRGRGRRGGVVRTAARKT